MHLYHPAGLREVEWIAASGFRRFPPRTSDQAIFRATPARDAAEAIARDWHTRDDASGYAGFVMRFEVRDSLLERYPLRAADDSGRRDLRARIFRRVSAPPDLRSAGWCGAATTTGIASR